MGVHEVPRLTIMPGEKILTIAGDLDSYAKVREFAEHLFDCAEIIWPDESAEHLAEIEGARDRAEDEPDDGVSLPHLDAMRGAVAVPPDPAPLLHAPPDAAAPLEERPASAPVDAPAGDETGLYGRDRRARMLAWQDKGKTVKDIANMFGTSEGAVSVALSQARKEAGRR